RRSDHRVRQRERASTGNEREQDTEQECARRRDPALNLGDPRLAQLLGHARTVLPAEPERIDARRQVPCIVGDQKRAAHHPPRHPDEEQQQREQRAHRTPTGPDQLVAERAQRSSHSRLEPVDQSRVRALRLETGHRTGRDADQVRVAVEHGAVPGDRLTQPLAVPAVQLAQHRQHHEREPCTQQGAIVPGRLDRERAQQHRRACRTYRLAHAISDSSVPHSSPSRKMRLRSCQPPNTLRAAARSVVVATAMALRTTESGSDQNGAKASRRAAPASAPTGGTIAPRRKSSPSAGRWFRSIRRAGSATAAASTISRSFARRSTTTEPPAIRSHASANTPARNSAGTSSAGVANMYAATPLTLAVPASG